MIYYVIDLIIFHYKQGYDLHSKFQFQCDPKVLCLERDDNLEDEWFRRDHLFQLEASRCSWWEYIKLQNVMMQE